MVKAIVEENGERMPSFFGYVRLGGGVPAAAVRAGDADLLPLRRARMPYVIADDLPDEPAGERFRRLLDAPGDPADARRASAASPALLAKQAGFEALYLSGAAMSATMGLPDLGMITVDEVVLLHPPGGARVRPAGAGRWRHRLWRGAERHAHGPLLRGSRRRRGASRGPAAAQEVRPPERQEARRRADDMAAKVAAARKARRAPVIIARTDAAASEGMDGAVARARSSTSRPAPTRSSPRR